MPIHLLEFLPLPQNIMPLTARVKSASKTDFISGLGLVKDDSTTKHLYDLMKVKSSRLPGSASRLELILGRSVKQLAPLIPICEEEGTY